MTVGGDRPVMIAGPCSVEFDYPRHAAAIAAAGAHALRAGVYKHRTNPDSFQGLGRQALPLLEEARRRTGLPLVSEVLAAEDAEMVADHVDAYQVGARNMQNVRLLEALGEIGKPVVLKRGLAATVDEWIAASEYIRRRGNDDVVLCERGIRTFEPRTRNTLDLSAVVVAHEITDLPVIVDPSHAAGQRRWVPALAQAALAAGADGLLVEVHVAPESAWSDADQAIDVEACRLLISHMQRIRAERGSLTSIAEGRELIDCLDEEIRRLILARRDVSAAIQSLRLRDGGHRLDPAREEGVTDAYRSALGATGELLAHHLLTLCRGDATGPGPYLDA
jgi:3-deoxy-7-phosphoheptulonate synthase